MAGPTPPGSCDPTWPGGDGPTWPGGDPTAVYPAAPPTRAVSAPSPHRPPPLPPAWRSGRTGRARTVVGVVLLFVAGLAAVGALAAGWTRTQLRDEETWAATGQALADDPEVQADVARALADQVVEAVGVQDTLEGLLPGPLDGLADPVTGLATDGVDALALRLVRTDAFARAWDAAVRASHQELLAALDGDGRVTAVTSEGVVLDLGATLEEFRRLLGDNGVPLLDGVDLSTIDVQYLLIDAPGLRHVRDLLAVLDVLVVALPLVALGAGAIGLVVARRRSVAVAAGGAGAVLAAGGIFLLAEAGRSVATDGLTGGVLGAGAAGAVVDHVTGSLDPVLAAAGVGGLVVLVAGGAVALATSPVRR